MVERIEMMDNFLINMTLATCDGWIMDNLPIIMTLGTPRPLLGMREALAERWGGIFVALDVNIAQLSANVGRVLSW